jgi:hypothetical protein
MRVLFYRPVDHQRGHAVVARDDGVVYELDGGFLTGAKLPHDLVHFTVEETLGITDGIWAAIAGGVVFHSMTHVTGRRPPHAAERSARLIREHRDSLQRAEAVGGYVERVADGRLRFTDIPATLGLDAEAVRRAADALHEAEARWRELAVGEQLTRHWPAYKAIRIGAQSRRSRSTASSRTSSRLQKANRTRRRPAS